MANAVESKPTPTKQTGNQSPRSFFSHCRINMVVRPAAREEYEGHKQRQAG
jgi:hypothetical protein